MNMLESLYRRLTPPAPAPTRPKPPARADSGKHLHVALTAITALYAAAEARDDQQAMRYYAQAVRCLLGPSRMYLGSSDEDCGPQPEWPEQ